MEAKDITLHDLGSEEHTMFKLACHPDGSLTIEGAGAGWSASLSVPQSVTAALYAFLCVSSVQDRVGDAPRLRHHTDNPNKLFV